LHAHNYPLFAIAALVAVLTTFYMFRLFFVAFVGEPKTHEASHAHESPGVMIWPLRILAIASIVGGVIGIEQIYVSGGDAHCTMNSIAERLLVPFVDSPFVATCSLLAVVIGFAAAYALYAKADKDPLPEKLGVLATAMRNKFYFDEIYEATFIRAHDSLAAVADWIDRRIVEGFCIGLVRGGTDLTGRALRLVQTGNLQTYAFLFVLGVAVVLWFVLK